VGWKLAPIGGLQYQTHMQAPKYDVQFLRSEVLRSSSSSRTRQIKECYITYFPRQGHGSHKRPITAKQGVGTTDDVSKTLEQNGFGWGKYV